MKKETISVKNEEVDFNYIQEKAAQGDPEYLYRLAKCYERGEGIPRDYKKAFSLYDKAARKGHGPAAEEIAYSPFAAINDPNFRVISFFPSLFPGEEVREQLLENAPEKHFAEYFGDELHREMAQIGNKIFGNNLLLTFGVFLYGFLLYCFYRLQPDYVIFIMVILAIPLAGLNFYLRQKNAAWKGKKEELESMLSRMMRYYSLLN